MPIRTGTRLERLEQLQRRTKQELDVAKKRGAARWEIVRLNDLSSQLNVAIKAERRRTHGNSVDHQLKTLNVTAKTVRAWALAQGLTKSTRGRLGAELVEAYIAHHTSHNRRSFPNS